MTGRLSPQRRALLSALRSDPPQQPLPPQTPQRRQLPPAAAGLVLAPVRRSGSGRRLFCPPPVSGSAYCYLELSRQLRVDVAVDSFTPPGFDDGAAPVESVTTQAADCVELIRQRQPRGPYLLAGWSFGGVVAFEVARQLVDLGLAVDLVCLIDAGRPASAEPSEAQVREAFIRDVAAMAGRPPPAKSDVDEHGLAAQLREAGLIPPEVGDDFLRRRFGVFRANMRALLAYRPLPYPGGVTVVRGAESDESWQVLADVALGGVRTRVVPGDHYTMWLPGNLAHLASALDTMLDGD